MLQSICLLCLCLAVVATASVVQLTKDNADSTLDTSELAFVNFYAEWCPHSQSLSPVIEEVGEKLKAEFADNARLVIGKTDCEKEKELAQKYGIIKFPTMKLFRFGRMQTHEYRGQRSVQAISDFIRGQMADSLVRLAAPVEISALPLTRGEGAMIGRFDSNDSNGLQIFSRAANQLRDDCKFIAVVGTKTEPDSVAFIEGTDPTTQVNLTTIDASSIGKLVQDHCVSIVRELTYENAESIIEEGRPLLTLFYRADDDETVGKYKATVEKHLGDYSRHVTFLYGQGPLFIRALRQLRKTVSDLPILALDSFQHMFNFPHDVRDSLANNPRRISAFIDDLINGKLHAEFHRAEQNDGPTATTAAGVATDPPASVFHRLAPSETRYSFYKEEL